MAEEQTNGGKAEHEERDLEAGNSPATATAEGKLSEEDLLVTLRQEAEAFKHAE